MAFLPQYLANRLSQRAQHAIFSACNLATSQNEVQPAHLLHSLSNEDGSLAKSILESHHITSASIASLLSPKPPLRSGTLRQQRGPSRFGPTAVGLSDQDLLRQPPFLRGSRSPRSGRNHFSEQLRSIFKRATQAAVRHHQPYIGTEHLLYALVCQGDLCNNSQFKKKLKKVKAHLDDLFSQGVRFPDILKKWRFHSPHDFPNTPFFAPRKRAQKSPREDGLSSSKIKQGSSKKATQKIASKYHPHRPQQARDLHEHDHSGKHSATVALDTFCQNLTLRAEQNFLDPVIGREKEIARIIHILSRRTKNNPLLVGEPGVGKTAIIQGLAQRIHRGEVPGNLLHARVYALNLNSLIAGTMFRGDFEARMHDLLEEASGKASGHDVILAIDEIHTVIGAGAGAGSLDVANILKPGLSQGTLRVIGATTLEEYRKYIEKDRALERRFQPVIVEEETEEQSVQTLSSLKKLYEQHHGITIGDDAIKAAVTLSSRYIRDRYLPDKALDVLDEAASRLKSDMAITERTKKIRELEQQKLALAKRKEFAIRKENYQQAIALKHKTEAAEEEIRRFQKNFPLYLDTQTLQTRHIEETVSEMTGIPIQKNESDAQKIKELSRYLSREIIGQKEAVTSLILTLKRNKAGIGNPARPTGSFLFLGPSGVGKTALAKALSDAHSQPLIKLDMSEYAEPHTISRLIGSPPGYVGYGESAELCERIRRNPYAVVLFDEIDKASPVVHNLLLSILEEGTVRDATGRSVSLKNAIILLTSNAGTEHATNERGLGFSATGKRVDQNQHMEGIKEFLRPELLNRIDKIITFRMLGKKDISQITKLNVEKLAERLLPLRMDVSSGVIDYIAERAYKPGQGARLVRTTIEELVEGPLAEYLIQHGGTKKLKVEVTRGKIIVRENRES